MWSKKKRSVDYNAIDVPVADRICDETNFEVKVQPPCTEDDMVDVAVAVRKVLANIKELKQVRKPEKASQL